MKFSLMVNVPITTSSCNSERTFSCKTARILWEEKNVYDLWKPAFLLSVRKAEGLLTNLDNVSGHTLEIFGLLMAIDKNSSSTTSWVLPSSNDVEKSANTNNHGLNTLFRVGGLGIETANMLFSSAQKNSRSLATPCSTQNSVEPRFEAGTVEEVSREHYSAQNEIMSYCQCMLCNLHMLPQILF